MDVWLLGAGAVVLIGITLWIVWPARAAEADKNPMQKKEALESQMTDSTQPGAGLPPQGDEFEDQYTSATADLSAGGVAAALESMQEDDPTAPASPVPPVEADRPSIVPPFGRTPPPRTPPTTVRTGPEPRKIGMGAAVVLAVGGGVGGAWLYARWQRERNKPINRLRRGARELGSRLGERMPEVDDLPQAAAPMSGAAAALLLAGVLAGRLLRRDADGGTDQVRDAVQGAGDRGQEAARRGRAAAEQGGREAMRRGREAGSSELLNEAVELALRAAARGRKVVERGGRAAASRGREVADSDLVRETLERGSGGADRARKEAGRSRKALERGGRVASERGRAAAEQGRDVARRGGKRARRLRSGFEAQAEVEPTAPARLGIGLGGTAVAATAAYLIWRLTHRGPPQPKPWYAGGQV